MRDGEGRGKGKSNGEYIGGQRKEIEEGEGDLNYAWSLGILAKTRLRVT